MAVKQHGWVGREDPNRPVERVTECLVAQTISGEITFPRPRGALVVCDVRHCIARSDHVGEMPCHQILTAP